MGIKNLHKLLTKWENVISETTIDDYKNKKIAIDISILIYQIIIAIRNTGTDITNSRGEITSHILGIFNKTISLIEMGIYPVYVFDGKPPNMKNTVLKSRREQRKKAKIKMSLALTSDERIKYFKRSVVVTKKQLAECRHLLKLMGMPIVNAPEEADSQCAQLAKDGYVYGVSTEDMDILTFGAPRIIRNLASRKKNIIEINLKDILSNLDINYDQFIDLCILLGCDYCPTIPGIGMKKSLQIIKKYDSIDNFIKKNNNEPNNEINIKFPEDFQYIKTQKYFKNPSVLQKNEIRLEWNNPEYDKLEEFLVKKHGFNRNKILKSINRLKKACKNYMNYNTVII